METIYSSLYNDFTNISNMMTHCLIELSQKQFDRTRNNAIIVSDLNSANDIVWYRGVKYGKNIRCQRKFREQLTNKACDVIDIFKIKNNCLTIVTKKEECIQLYPMIHIIPMASLYQHCPKNKSTSGYVLLFIGTSNKDSSIRNCIWNEEDFKNLKRCKKNVIKKMQIIMVLLGIILALKIKLNLKYKMILQLAFMQHVLHMVTTLKIIYRT